MNATTKMIPNNLLYGIDCNIRLYTHSIPKERIPEAHVRIKKMHELHQRLWEYLTNTNKQMAKYYNWNHVPKQFWTGQFVKLSTRNLKLKHPKLAPWWVGLFWILERIGGQAYQIVLPDKYSRLHDVFPIQLLKSYNQRNKNNEQSLPMPDLIDE
jgi:hypothetical protein